jgi:hypothetical protein
MSPATESPLVSAVIPVHNGQRFLGDAISSVLGQSYSRLECVVVDDGSTDSTPAVTRSFGRAVRYIRKRNGGVSSARNRGIEESRGKFVAFLDADDLWLEKKIECQVETALERPEVGLVYTAATIVNGKLQVVGELDAPPPSLALRNTLLLEKPYVPAVGSTALVPKFVFGVVGLFDENLSTSADCDLTCRIAARFPTAAIHKSLALYRRHPNQMHMDPRLAERDMNLVFSKFFSEGAPDGLVRMRNRAQANLHVSLAGTYLLRRDYYSFLRHGLSAAIKRPDRALNGARSIPRVIHERRSARRTLSTTLAEGDPTT